MADETVNLRHADGNLPLQRELALDHQRLHELGARVAACIDADDPFSALEEWPIFERRLLAHLDAEEMHLLPRFDEIEPAEANALRAQHAAMRAELGRIGIALELHNARKPMFDAFFAALRAHSAREEAMMYAWAERALPERVAAAVLRLVWYRPN